MDSPELARLEALLVEFRAIAKSAPKERGSGFRSWWHLSGYVFAMEEAIAKLRKHERRVEKVQSQIDRYHEAKAERA